MERFTISLSDALADNFDSYIKTRGYSNRSEAVRDLLRKEIEIDRVAKNEPLHCIASLSYIYNHHERSLAERLANLQHLHHHVIISSVRAHLDHDHCVETLLLKGMASEVRGFSDKVCAEPGVRHGTLNLVPVEISSHSNASELEHPHIHYHPLT